MATETAQAQGAGRTADTPDIRLAGVRKLYGDVVAVDGVDIDIRRGEFFTLLGPSGSGKTTCLRMIAGFERPDAGSIELAGEDVSRLPPAERDVNTVFQDYALFPHMTVGENVAYGLKVKKVAKGERAKRVEEALAMVRLEGYGERRPSQLSGGQRQRVALARALVNRPRGLLPVEPRPGDPPPCSAARGAARRAQPEAPSAAPGRSEADPAGGRHHVRLRDPRPG